MPSDGKCDVHSVEHCKKKSGAHCRQTFSFCIESRRRRAHVRVDCKRALARRNGICVRVDEAKLDNAGVMRPQLRRVFDAKAGAVENAGRCKNERAKQKIRARVDLHIL